MLYCAFYTRLGLLKKNNILYIYSVVWCMTGITQHVTINLKWVNKSPHQKQEVLYLVYSNLHLTQCYTYNSRIKLCYVVQGVRVWTFQNLLIEHIMYWVSEFLILYLSVCKTGFTIKIFFYLLKFKVVLNSCTNVSTWTQQCG